MVTRAHGVIVVISIYSESRMTLLHVAFQVSPKARPHVSNWPAVWPLYWVSYWWNGCCFSPCQGMLCLLIANFCQLVVKRLEHWSFDLKVGASKPGPFPHNVFLYKTLYHFTALPSIVSDNVWRWGLSNTCLGVSNCGSFQNVLSLLHHLFGQVNSFMRFFT